METKTTAIESSSLARDDNHRDSTKVKPSAAPLAGESMSSAGGSQSEAIGGPVGFAFGVGADISVGEAKGAMAAETCVSSKNAATAVNPVSEHEFWRKELVRRPYFTHGTSYDHYGPAFQLGWESYANHKGKTFEDIEPQLGRDWELMRGKSMLSWNNAKKATLDAWQRTEKASRGGPCSSA